MSAPRFQDIFPLNLFKKPGLESGIYYASHYDAVVRIKYGADCSAGMNDATVGSPDEMRSQRLPIVTHVFNMAIAIFELESNTFPYSSLHRLPYVFVHAIIFSGSKVTDPDYSNGYESHDQYDEKFFHGILII